MPILYETILIGRRVLQSLLDSLRSQQLGRWTKRLEVVMRGKSAEWRDREGEFSLEDDEDLDTRRVAEILYLLPNLRILGFSILNIIPSNIFIAIAQTFAQDLEVHQFHEDCDQPGTYDVMASVQAMPNLRVLKCNPTFQSAYTSWFGDAPDTVTLPHLRSAYIFNLSGFDTTSIVHGTIHGNGTFDIPSCPNLTHLEFVQEIEGFRLIELMDAIRDSQSCPLLERIDFHWLTWPVNLRGLQLPPSVHTFGISSRRREPRTVIYNFVSSFFSPLGAGLRKVRLTDRRNYDNLRLWHQEILHQFVQGLESRGLQLEDDDGRQVTIS